MTKILTLITALLIGSGAFAMSADDALSFFTKYVNDANAQSPKIVDYYEPNAKIIRVVVLPDGKTESVTTDMKEYTRQLKIGANLAKLNKYKNFYTDRKVTKVGNDYKITCQRQPSTSDYKLPAHFVIGTDANGNMKIKEEMMYTKQTAILRKAKANKK